MVFSLGFRLLHALRGQERNRLSHFRGRPQSAQALYRVFMMEPMDKSAGTGTDAGDDMRLVARVRAGDPQALAELYDRYSSVVYAVGLRILQDTGAAEDILQDIFLQLWRSPRLSTAAAAASEPGWRLLPGIDPLTGSGSAGLRVTSKIV